MIDKISGKKACIAMFGVSSLVAMAGVAPVAEKKWYGLGIVIIVVAHTFVQYLLDKPKKSKGTEE